MREYKYKVETQIGNIISGRVKAESIIDAENRLPSHTRIIMLRDVGATFEIPQVIRKRLNIGNPTKKELSMLFSQLGYMLNAGISTVAALDTVLASGSVRIQGLVSAVLQYVSAGDAIGDAFEKAGGIDVHYVLYIKAGQNAGTLDETFNQLSMQIESQLETERKVKTAMAYPVVLLVITIGIVLFMFNTIIPQTIEAFQQLGSAEVPQLTQIVMNISNVITAYGWLIGIGTIIFILILIYLIRRYMMYYVNSLLLRIPLVKAIIRNKAFIDFYRTLRFMLQVGNSAAFSFATAVSVVNNRAIKKQLFQCQKRLEAGMSIAEVLSMASYTSPMERQSLNVGVKAGRTVEVLDKILKQLEKDNDAAIKRFVTALEPIMLVVIGGLVGVLVLSVYLPMFTMISDIQ